MSDGTARCGNCEHFRDSPAHLEREVPGLNILSSAWGSVRADAGLCAEREIVTVAGATCDSFSPRPATP